VTHERTVTYSRKVWVEVEETDERLKDEGAGHRWSATAFIDDAKDAAIDKAKTHTVTGWEPLGQPEYEAVSAEKVEKPNRVDVIV
jgi:hypothetical protein